VNITKDKILDILISEEHAASMNYDLYINDVENKQLDSLLSRLTGIEEEEEGGRTAISGFFYQMLIATDYIIQMLEGTWDFVAVELHDDIVVGKGDKIRFVQVKSSKHPHQLVADTGLYKRTLFKDEGEEFYKNDSWVDKLIAKSRHFPEVSGYKCEFELATSYHFIKGSNATDVSLYNEEFPNDVPDEDILLKKLLNNCVDKDKNSFDYENVCGEKLQSLLKRFRIKKFPDGGNKIYDYMQIIQSKFGALLGQNMQLSSSHLRELIGNLLERCLTQNGKSVLYLTRQEAEEMKLDFRARVIASFGQQNRSDESIEVIRNVFSDIHAECIIKHELYADLQHEIIKCHASVIKWIEEEPGDVEMLLSRYGHGTTRTWIVLPVERNRLLQTLFRGNIMLSLVNRSTAMIVRGNKSLLLKSIGQKHISFLHVQRMQTFENGCEKLRYIIEGAPKSEQLSLLTQKPMTIIDGHYDDLRIAKSIRIAPLSKELDELGQDSDLTKPPVEFHVIPGKFLQQQFEESIFDCDSIDDVFSKWTSAMNSLGG
jgi:hypothetical protein